MIFRRIFFFFSGYFIVRSFYTKEECGLLRKYVESLDWEIGATNLKQGSLLFRDVEAHPMLKKIFPSNKINYSKRVIEDALGLNVMDLGFRSVQLRMHSPIWHIDMQTFANDLPSVARDRRFKVVKCGVYLQNEKYNGGGTLEVKTPYLGGGVKNLWHSKLSQSCLKDILSEIHAPQTAIKKIIRQLGHLSDAIQFWVIRLNIKEGDLLIFSGGLMHRASQPRNKNNKIVRDSNTGFYVDLSDSIGKIMLQWEFTAQNDWGYIYRTHSREIKYR